MSVEYWSLLLVFMTAVNVAFYAADRTAVLNLASAVFSGLMSIIILLI
jgi:hypothetical protein